MVWAFVLRLCLSRMIHLASKNAAQLDVSVLDLVLIDAGRKALRK